MRPKVQNSVSVCPERDRGREADSFYHLADCSLAGKVCNGTGCFVARHLDPQRFIRAEQQNPRVYCLGQCFAGPACADSAARPNIQTDTRQPIVLRRLVKGIARSLAAYRFQGGYRAWEMALHRSPDDIIKDIEKSGLRGRGGAGFPAGRKWRSAACQVSPEKFVVANADEGDAGAYIDRFILEDDPHAVIEGILITARAIGATRGWIYLRSEYPAAKLILEDALNEARQAGLLGVHTLGVRRGFDIEIHVGQGSYVCGEETALLRSIEGKRPEVMARPPYATEHGLFGNPTVVNNVETLATIPWIVEYGGDSYSARGFSQSRGTKVVSLNSLFNRPGLYEVEFGVSIRHIVEELGGGLRGGAKLKGMIIGGPLAGIIPPHLLDTRLGFEELRSIGASLGHGGVIAFDDHTSILELLHHVFAFAAYESCGKCTPCRLGSRRIELLIADALETRDANLLQPKECERIITALKLTSLCGLGTGLAEFAESAWRHYGKELELCLR
jgi:NADH:ubiquinone oxidoreductase subunit F (NADH-binding)